MFKLTKKHRLQVIGFLIIFLLILTFLPILFTEQPHQNAEKIALKQKNIQYVTESELENQNANENETYQDLSAFIAQNELDVDNQDPPIELKNTIQENTQSLSQHEEVEPLNDLNQLPIVQPPTIDQTSATQEGSNEKLSMDDLIQNVDKKTLVQTTSAAVPSIQTETIEKSRLKQSYYVRLAALTRLDYLEEKLQLLRKHNYVTKTRKSGEFTILMTGPFNSKKEAAEVLPKMIQLGFKDAKIIKE